MIDPGNGKKPLGSSVPIDQMLMGGLGDRQANFEMYYQGWSNSKIQSRAV